MKSRLGLKLLGLCALVVGLMAFGASAAQAEESGGKWTFINTSGVLGELPNNQNIGGKLETGTDATLLTEILKKKVEFLCTSFTVLEGKLITGGTALGKLLFHGCTTKVGGVTQAACEPFVGANKGLIETNKIKGTLLLHKLEGGTKDQIIIAEPDEGEKFFAIIRMSELCSIGSEVPVGGKFAIKPTNPITHEVEHLITEFVPLTHLWTISDTAEHAAHIDGSALVRLTGTNEGRSWAALWN
jgi:hypothetical protein